VYIDYTYTYAKAALGRSASSKRRGVCHIPELKFIVVLMNVLCQWGIYASIVSVQNVRLRKAACTVAQHCLGHEE
jgi:hypothetical protein